MADDKLEEWRDLTARLIDSVRIDGLRSGHLTALKAWEYLAARVRLATHQTTTVQAWGSRLLETCGVQAPSSWTSSALRDLVASVGSDTPDWLALVGEEVGALIAMAQLIVDERKDRRAERAAGNEVF